MATQVKLQWNQTSVGANVSQTLEKKVADGAWTTLRANGTLAPEAGDATKFIVIDTAAAYDVDTAVQYRVVTSNGVYSVQGNEITVNVPASLAPVDNLTGDVEDGA